MDKKTRIRLGFDKYESEKIHDELFEKSLEHKYYSLGVAQGMYFIYKMLYKTKEKNISLKADVIMDAIKNTATQNVNISDYFLRLLKDVDID